jgi:hypothetical protein
VSPTDERKARVLASIRKERSPVRRDVRRRTILAWLAGSLWVLAVFVALGGLRAVDRPVTFVLRTAAGWAAVAVAATWGASRGGSMLGRPRSVLFAVIVAAPLSLEAWYAGCLMHADFTVGSWPVAGGARCVLATLMLAAAPFAALFAGRRGLDPTHPKATGAVLGVVSGAWAAVLIDLHCEHADLVHVTLGHVLPVVLCVGLGVACGAAWLGVRPERRADEASSAERATSRGA